MLNWFIKLLCLLLLLISMITLRDYPHAPWTYFLVGGLLSIVFDGIIYLAKQKD